MPATQDWHWYWPAPSAYVPGAQLRQEALLEAAFPVEYVPAAHVVHRPGPRDDLYEPALHGLHDAWTG